MTNQPVVVTQQVTKMWTDRAGLRPLDLSVDAGEIAVVRGRSGTGKSTLLAVLAGWCRPDGGHVLIDGRAPGEREPWHHIALVPQMPCLASELTLAEVVADALALERDDAHQMDVDQRSAGRIAPGRIAAEWLQRLDLSEQSGRLPHAVSSGQQQRAAVARAAAAAPTLLLADEPTSFQGDQHVDLVLGQFRRLAESGTAIVIATHSAEVVALADQVIDLS